MRIEAFYHGVIGLPIIGRFESHAGFDGIMFGMPGAQFHLEFTRGQIVSEEPVPGEESLLVLYLPDRTEFEAMVRKLGDSGAPRTRSGNPYWENGGATFLDPDGRRVVLFNGTFPAAI